MRTVVKRRFSTFSVCTHRPRARGVGRRPEPRRTASCGMTRDSWQAPAARDEPTGLVAWFKLCSTASCNTYPKAWCNPRTRWNQR